jgi:hypothetical protein
MKSVLLPISMLIMASASGQLVIDNATFFIGEGAVVTVQGNLTSNVAIQAGGAGANQGKIQLKGSSLQQINTNGNVIPRLEIDNTSHTSLTGDVRVGSRLEFTNGKIQLGNNNFIIEDGTEVVGAGTSKFLETTGTGQARRLVGANVADKVIPVGVGTNYTPFQYTTTGSTYGAGAYVGVQSTGAAVPTPQRHPRTESFLGTSWKVTKSGITGGNLVGTGTYTNPQVTGTEADIRGMFWNGSTWSLVGGAQNAEANTVAANVTSNAGEIYGMNRFLLVSPKVFLQGAYNSGTGLMNDGLRSGANLIPTSDPYRSAPYSAQYTHVNNSVGETVNVNLFNNNANPENDIVDWIYVELRSITSPTIAPIVQTRSVLVQRDGDLVDVDGVSPVYFKNVDPNNYAISFRHRTHIGLSTNPGVPIALGLNNTNLNMTNLADGSLFGTANINYLRSSNVNFLYSGNVNYNNAVNYIGLGNDRLALLNSVLSGSTTPINNAYSAGDVNMNRTANYIGLGNDRLFLLNTVLSGASSSPKSQSLPAN